MPGYMFNIRIISKQDMQFRQLDEQSPPYEYIKGTTM